MSLLSTLYLAASVPMQRKSNPLIPIHILLKCVSLWCCFLTHSCPVPCRGSHIHKHPSILVLKGLAIDRNVSMCHAEEAKPFLKDAIHIYEAPGVGWGPFTVGQGKVGRCLLQARNDPSVPAQTTGGRTSA